MLNPRFKRSFPVFFFISCEEGVNIVEEYDRCSLYPMLLNRYHYLHPIEKFEIECANQTIDADFELDIF